MSVVSSRVSNLSSILKSPGVRSQLVKQSNRVYFKLPKNIKNILLNFESNNGIKDYEDLICTLRNSNVKDIDLADFLTEVRQCVSLLGPIHKIFVEVLLQINWIDRSPEVISAYKIFLEDLICAQVYHGKCIIDKLVELFKPAENDIEWEAGEYRKEDVDRLNHIHDVLRKILKVVPMSSKLLLQSLRLRFPYIIHGTHVHEVYIYSLLQLLEYAPQLRSDILSLIINRLMVLDVNIPRHSDNDEDEDDAMESNDEIDTNTNTSNENKENIKSLHPIAHTLNVCMEQILKFIYDTCYVKEELNMESLKKLYLDILKMFETIILPTHGSQCVQYIMFYICSFKVVVVEAFLDWLWRKATDPNVPIILRHTCLSYIASLVAAASFVSSGKKTQSNLAKWIHNYINMEENSDYVSDDPMNHPVFYSVCQALFFIVTARHKDFIGTKNSMMCLHELDLPRIITCKLNPLKSCQSEVVHNFADIARTYQLAYCYTIIESNSRHQLPIIHDTNSCNYTLDSFFPYSTFTLNRSTQRLSHLFYDNSVNNCYSLINKHRTDIAEFMID